MFEKILIGAFSCVNTRLAFDIDRLPNCKCKKFDSQELLEYNNQKRKGEDLKVVFRLQLKDKGKYHE